jgi:NAD(P)-dependent dehydrogenase (short-subunit alcohol dehydrogenase family)
LYAARSYGGKVVLITGASRGIGRETALHYARAGASVAIVARTGDALNETKNMIVAAVPGADVLVLTADVRDIESVRSAVDGVLGHFGKLDILVANAGAITSFTPGECYLLPSCLGELSFHLIFIKGFDKKDPNAWWNTFEVNVRGVFNVVRYSLPVILCNAANAQFLLADVLKTRL